MKINFEPTPGLRRTSRTELSERNILEIIAASDLALNEERLQRFYHIFARFV